MLQQKGTPFVSIKDNSFAYKVEEGLHSTTMLDVWGILLLAAIYKYCSHSLSVMHRGTIQARRDLQEFNWQEVTAVVSHKKSVLSVPAHVQLKHQFTLGYGVCFRHFNTDTARSCLNKMIICTIIRKCCIYHSVINKC